MALSDIGSPPPGGPDDAPFLGCIGQESSDRLAIFFQQTRPGQPLPSFARCPARKQAEQNRRMGLNRCKSLFCPHCHGERQKGLRKRLAEFMSYAKGRGAGLSFLTLTAAHAANEPLQRSVEAVETAWKRARTGRPGKRVKGDGLLGVVSVIDVTHSVKGWHFHIHAIVVAKSQHSASACAALLAERYERALGDAGLNVSCATADHTDVYDEEGLAKYLAKPWRIEPGDGSKTPLQLLALGMQGSLQDFELYLEAMEAFQHKHRGVISPQLRRAINMI